MKYHIRQRAWTLREQFIVKDQSGNPAFRIKSRFFHIGDHLIIRDHQTHEKVARIKQHVFFHVRPHYSIFRSGTRWARLHEKFFNWGNEHFKLKLQDGTIYHIEGDITNWDFSVSDAKGNLLASIGQRVSVLRDYYGVDLAQGVDAPAIIALAITIEKIREHQPTQG
jgi:uncharacterized protein YxjI